VLRILTEQKWLWQAAGEIFCARMLCPNLLPYALRFWKSSGEQVSALRIGSLCIGFCIEKAPEKPNIGHAARVVIALKKVHARQRKVLTPDRLDGPPSGLSGKDERCAAEQRSAEGLAPRAHQFSIMTREQIG
jgi:hypothetical protein